MIELREISSYKILVIGAYFLCFIISVKIIFVIAIYPYATTKPLLNFSIMRNISEQKNGIVNDSYLKCEKPIRKIGFLKTHKCASTSIQNILLRFGRAHNLNFVIKSEGPHMNESFPYKRSMIKETLWEKAGLEYDMFLLHSIWNHREIAETLSDHGDVFYFSIIRNPAFRFRSSWDYYDLSRKYNETIEEYALKALKQRTPYKMSMLHEFGLPLKAMNDRVKVEEKIKEIDETFDLILLADKDYINDSIILLKDALCWEYRDMINFQLNSQNEQLVTSLSPRAYQALKGNQQSVDIYIYDVE